MNHYRGIASEGLNESTVQIESNPMSESGQMKVSVSKNESILQDLAPTDWNESKVRKVSNGKSESVEVKASNHMNESLCPDSNSSRE